MDHITIFEFEERLMKTFPQTKFEVNRLLPSKITVCAYHPSGHTHFNRDITTLKGYTPNI